MKRTTGAIALLAAVSGCVATEQGAGSGGGKYMSQAFNAPGGNDMGVRSGAYTARAAQGFQGPRGEPIAVTGAMAAGPKSEAEAIAQATLAQSLPPDIFKQVVYKNPQMASGLVQAGGRNNLDGGIALAGGHVGPVDGGIRQTAGPVCGPGGCPPGAMGPMPGMGGMPMMPGAPGMPRIPGAVASVGAMTGGAGVPFSTQRTSVRFVSPAGMRVSWFVPSADGKNAPSAQYLEAPGRYNFLQGAIYRLRLSDIPNRPGMELYPTLEVVPSSAKAAAFLAHSAVPVSFTEEDLEQVSSGNFVVKVIYLPDPQFQDLASTGPDEVVSSRLEPGVDPIAEAYRRGSILLIVRVGNIDLEAPNTPAMDAPGPNQVGRMPAGAMSPNMMGMMGPGGMMPPGMMPPGMAGRMPPAGAMGRNPFPPQLPGLPGAGLPPSPNVPMTLPMAPQGQVPNVQPPVIQTAPGDTFGKARPKNGAVQPVSFPAPPPPPAGSTAK